MPKAPPVDAFDDADLLDALARAYVGRMGRHLTEDELGAMIGYSDVRTIRRIRKREERNGRPVALSAPARKLIAMIATHDALTPEAEGDALRRLVDDYAFEAEGRDDAR